MMEVKRTSSASPEEPDDPPLRDGAAAAPIKLLLTMEEAAHALGVCRSFLYTLLEPGEIFSVKVGTRRLVPVRALNEYVERLIAQQKAS